MNTPRLHLPDELLLAYATGTLGAGPALFIETHLALCDHCRDVVDALEEVGGSIVENSEPIDAQNAGNDPVAWITGHAQEAPGRPPGAADPEDLGPIPVELADAIPSPVRQRLRVRNTWWPQPPHGRMKTILDGPEGSLHLLWVPPGGRLMGHRHRGAERALILHGGYHDDRGDHLPGDVAIRTEEHGTAHHVEADPKDGCIALMWFDAPPLAAPAPARFTQLLVESLLRLWARLRGRGHGSGGTDRP